MIAPNAFGWLAKRCKKDAGVAPAPVRMAYKRLWGTDFQV